MPDDFKEKDMPDGFLGQSHLRRLPVYLLLDCSSSMTGDPIIAVNEGLGIIYRQLTKDPQAAETAYLSVIRFADGAEQDELVSVYNFKPPILVAEGPTSIGAAFHVLVESIEHDLKQNNPTQHGDYRPLVFLLTDGRPTDDYHGELAKLKALQGSRKPTIVALGCGSEVDPVMLHEVTENVFLMSDVTPEAITSFFKWISGSITGLSHAVGGTDSSTDLLPPTIPGITYSPNQV